MVRRVKSAVYASVLALLCSLPLNGASIYLHHQAVSEGGSLAFLNGGTILLLIPASLALLSLLVSLPFLFVKRARGIAFCVLLSGFTYLVGARLCFAYAYDVRMDAFHQLANRSAVLVGAVEGYNLRNGRYPGTLKDLVPEFIAAVPKTGMGAYPEFDYATDPARWEGNPYVIFVNTPSGGLNWDRFLYFPEQNYPERGYGGTLERIGDWAYVYE